MITDLSQNTVHKAANNVIHHPARRTPVFPIILAKLVHCPDDGRGLGESPERLPLLVDIKFNALDLLMEKIAEMGIHLCDYRFAGIFLKQDGDADQRNNGDEKKPRPHLGTDIPLQ